MVSSNTVNMNHSQAVIQQGGHNNTQSGSITVEWGKVGVVVHELRRELNKNGVRAEVREHLGPEIDTLEAQLKKSAPSEIVVRETVRSLRSVTEGAVGSLIAAPTLALILELAHLVGLA